MGNIIITFEPILSDLQRRLGYRIISNIRVVDTGMRHRFSRAPEKGYDIL